MVTTLALSESAAHPLLIVPCILVLNFIKLGKIVLRNAWSAKPKLEVAHGSARRVDIVESRTGAHFLLDLFLRWDV